MFAYYSPIIRLSRREPTERRSPCRTMFWKLRRNTWIVPCAMELASTHSSYRNWFTWLMDWNLALRDNPLIVDSVEAWRWGPVVRKLYREYRDFRADPITRPPRTLLSSELTGQDKAMVESVWKAYKDHSPIELSILTHELGSAWDITRKSSPGS